MSVAPKEANFSTALKGRFSRNAPCRMYVAHRLWIAILLYSVCQRSPPRLVAAGFVKILLSWEYTLGVIQVQCIAPLSSLPHYSSSDTPLLLSSVQQKNYYSVRMSFATLHIVVIINSVRIIIEPSTYCSSTAFIWFSPSYVRTHFPERGRG